MELLSSLFLILIGGFLAFVALFGIGCSLQGPNKPTLEATIGAIILFGAFLYFNFG